MSKENSAGGAWILVFHSHHDLKKVSEVHNKLER